MTDDDYKPKTIKEAVERCFSCEDTIDLDLLYERPRRSLDWLYKNLGNSIIEACELNDNSELLQACSAKTADEAARTIIRAILKTTESENS